MAPFFAKFVKASTSVAEPTERLRTFSDVGALKESTPTTTVTSNVTPTVILTKEDGNSPVQPFTPGSLHRSDSPRVGRLRTISLSPRKNLRSLSPSPSRKTLPGNAESHAARSRNNTMLVDTPSGLGIDFGQPVQPSHASHGPESNNSSIKKKSSSRSLMSLKLSGSSKSSAPPQAQDVSITVLAQEVVVPASERRSVLVESPTSNESSIGSPPVSIHGTVGLQNGPPSASTTTKPSLQTHNKDADAISIASNVSSSKISWRRGSASSSNKKRKATGVAGAIAASGIALANPTFTSSNTSHPSSRSPPYSAAQSTPNPGLSSNGALTETARTRHRTRSESLVIPDHRDAEGAENIYGDQLYTGLSSNEDEASDLEDDIPVTGFAVASSKRNADFHEMFQQVPEGDYLIEDYVCALQREILIQGRLYISENHICFHANIFGWITELIIPIYEVTSIEKKMTALFIPNAIQINTRTAKYTFTSFLSRDTTYDVIYNIWRLARPDAESVPSGDASTRASYDQQRPLTHDSIAPSDKLLTSIAQGQKATQCKCGKDGVHYSDVAMVATFPGTPEQIYNLMFTSGFIKDFMREDQFLQDLQISDWVPDPESKLLSRNFSYIKILNGVVKQTKCELKDETLHCDFSDYITTVTTTRTPDVPSGNAFVVKTRTCIMWAGPAVTKVLVTSQVEWTGRSFIKAMINSSAIDGQKKYHAGLERAMRKYIAENKSEFIPEGMEDVIKAPIEEAAREEAAITASPPPLTEEEANKRREHERNQRATQWAFDTVMGAWNVAKHSTLDAIDLVSDAWDQSSSTTILWFVIVVLVISNLWTLLMVGRHEEVGRRKEMRHAEQQRRWVMDIVSAIWEERQALALGEHSQSTIPPLRESWKDEMQAINIALDAVEARVGRVRRTLEELD